jgi:hypothetical protein
LVIHLDRAPTSTTACTADGNVIDEWPQAVATRIRPTNQVRRTSRGYVRADMDPCHDVPMAARSIRHRLLGNTVVRTVLSLWAWLMLGVIIIIWVPLVAIVRLVTAPFDKGRYAAGYLSASSPSCTNG